MALESGDALSAVKTAADPDTAQAAQHPAAKPSDTAAGLGRAIVASAEVCELRNVQRLLWALLILLLLVALYFTQAIFVPIVAALLLSFLFKPIVRRLEAWKIPPPASGLIIMGTLFLLMIAGIGSATDSARGWIETLPQASAELERKFAGIRENFRQVTEATATFSDMARGATGADIEAQAQGEGEVPPAPVPVEVKPSPLPTGVISTSAALGAGFTLTLILAYFFLAAGDLLLRQLVQALPRMDEKKEAVEAWRDLETHVSSYLVTVTCINLGLGLVTWGLLWLYGVPYAMWWGLVATTLNFVPYIGPLAATAGIFLASVLHFDSIGEAFLPPLTFIAIQAAEGNFVTPMIVGRRMSLNPLVLFLWVVFWGWMWGIAGALLAVPMLICFKIACDHVQSLEWLSNLLSGYVRRAGDGREPAPKPCEVAAAEEQQRQRTERREEAAVRPAPAT